MTNGSEEHSFINRQRWALTLLTVIVLSGLLYAADLAKNPPGFYIDESSVAYNAHLIAQTGKDEHGEAWPLFFQAFGEYKNPVYIYVLAVIFRLTGPSILVARLLSALLGVATALVLGLLATRITRRRGVGLLVVLTTLLTPWLFEISRVVMEVALYPLALSLFLLSVYRASLKLKWSPLDIAFVAASLALLTYTYSIGRLLAPLLAIGLVIFATRRQWTSILLTWGAYAVTLLPLFVFSRTRPGALTGRFKLITYLEPQSTYAEMISDFIKHFVGNLNPWRLLVNGDPNFNQVAHIYGMGHILLVTAVLAVAGTYLALRHRGGDAWWRFVCYGLVASIVPASLTIEYFHMLRLIAIPVFLVVLNIPALEWLMAEGARTRRVALSVVVVLTILQGGNFYRQYHAESRSARRLHLFDADYPTMIFPAALAIPSRPIFLADAVPIPGYIQAFWYSTLRGVPQSVFMKLAPDAYAPESATVITTENSCPRCQIIAKSEPYTVYIADGPPKAPRTALAAEGFRASISLAIKPTTLHTREQVKLSVGIRNDSLIVWPGRERGAEPFQLSVGNHWLDHDGNMIINDDGRAALLDDLRPSEEAWLELVINAPRKPGDYLLEIDMLQEGVSWFGAKGSHALRLPVRIE